MPYTLLDYFPDDYLVVVDESHVTVPQLHGQYLGDLSRKDTLVEHGFRLPSARDNRPLRFEEFMEKVNQAVFLSATPSPYEIEISTQVVEQIVRPTGLIDPEVLVRPTKGQIDDLVGEIRTRTDRDQRVLVTTLTKKMAEDLTEYLLELGLRVRYLHSEIDTLERIEILRGAAAGRLRRAGRHQPAAGGPRPARGVAGRHPRRRQGRLPPVGDVADPDDRPRRPQRRRPGGDVRRPDDRLDAQGALGDQPAAQGAARVQHRARDRPADGPQEGHRHPRDAAGLRRRGGAAGSGARPRPQRPVGPTGARRCSTSPTCRPTTSAA